jgi:uncharacterized membrane protein
MNPNLGSSIGLSRACLGLVCLAVSATVSAQVHFYGTGQLPGGANYSQMRDAIQTPNGILAVGTATLYSLASGDTPVMWTPSGGLVPLANDFPSNTSNSFVCARVIAANGAAIGGSARNAATGNERSPAIWTNSGTTVTLLGSLGLSPVVNSGVNCLSADGSVAYGFIVAGFGSGPFRYTTTGGMMAIGSFTPSPHSTSWDGAVVVGGTYNSDGSYEAAFRYTYTGLGPTGGTLTVLPTLSGGTWASAIAMTPGATITSGVCDSPDYPNGQLVRWHEGGPTEALGSPDPTYWFMNIGGATADGSMVAITLGDDTDQWSYIHNPSGWFKIQDILSDAGVDLTGWSLDSVLGISGDGTLLYGSGQHNGNTEGWVAEFPVGILRAYGDTTPPTFLALSASPSAIWPPNHKMVPVTLTASVVDAVSTATAHIISVACNEPASGDWQITGPLTLSLRATRLGSGNGRIYTITVQATDAAGNSTTRTVTVSVPHDQGHG